LTQNGNADSFAASADMTQSGADVVIKYGATDQVTLLNVSLNQLSANDFASAVLSRSQARHRAWRMRPARL
jgi:hypothetical protein